MNYFFIAQADPETYGIDIIKVLTESSFMVQAVLYLLVLMSVICWFIIGYKWFYFHRANKITTRFLDVFWTSKHLDKVYEAFDTFAYSPSARVFKEAYKEMRRIKAADKDQQDTLLSGFENIERTIRRARQIELTKFETLIPFLGTTGSTAPFVGLFGTVWGIVEAFDRIPKGGGAILDKVAGPMAHALIATAVGLLAAIPAVMAYNWFVRQIKVSSAQVDGFSDEFLNIVRRHFVK